MRMMNLILRKYRGFPSISCIFIVSLMVYGSSGATISERIYDFFEEI